MQSFRFLHNRVVSFLYLITINIIFLSFYIIKMNRRERPTYEQYRKPLMSEYMQVAGLQEKPNVLPMLLPNSQKWGREMNLKKFGAILNLSANCVRCY